MSSRAKEFLAKFDSLPSIEKDEVMQQLLIRQYPYEVLPIGSTEEAAEELFLSYDAAEDADASTR